MRKEARHNGGDEIFTPSLPPASVSEDPGCDLDDLEIVVKATPNGKQAAMEDLLCRIHPIVLRYCRARIGSWGNAPIAAEDIAQEVCLAVITAVPGYRNQGKPFLAFVFGIAAHKVADARRLAARRSTEPVSEFPDHPAELADGPEQRVLQSELTARLNSMLEQLPAKQREILALRVVVGLSAEETAEAVGSTPGAVRVAQHRALIRLRSMITRRRSA
jgi:RNA polymerase sigma-70 factor, ECF subfamily